MQKSAIPYKTSVIHWKTTMKICSGFTVPGPALWLALVFTLVWEARARVELANPSFEEPFSTDDSGYTGPIPGWEMPSPGHHYGVAWRNSTYWLYDNGLEPHGTKVAFLRMGNDRFNPVLLSQRISGFKAGKTYLVSFRANARAVYFAPLHQLSSVSLRVSLGGQVVLSDREFKAVEPPGSFTLPFAQVTCEPFTPTQDGALDLQFAYWTTAGVNENLWVALHEQTLILDDVRIRLQTNEPPEFLPIPPQQAVETLEFQCKVQAVDEQFQTITYSLDQAPEGCTIDPDSDEIRWTPSSSQVGTHAIRVRAVDDASPPLSATSTIQLTVVTRPSFQMERLENRVKLSWPGRDQTDYLVQRKRALEGEEDWISVSPLLIGSEGQMLHWEEEDLESATGFYRLQLFRRP
jgi:hypothetical protein